MESHISIWNRIEDYGAEDIEYRGCILWSSTSNDLKNCQSLKTIQTQLQKVESPTIAPADYVVFIKRLGYSNRIITSNY